MTKIATDPTDTTIPDHSDRDHAEFSPSSLKYVAKCPAYEGRSDDDTESSSMAAAEKGTRIHEALEIRDPKALHDDEEVQIYDDIVKMEAGVFDSLPMPTGRDDFVDLHEIRLNIMLHLGLHTFGTCDRFSYWENADIAIMGDYKTGISRIDPPGENWQAKAYVAGAFQKFPQINHIEFIFYVPFHDGTSVSENMRHTFHRDNLPRLIDELSDVISKGVATRPKWKFDPEGNVIGQPTLDDCGPSPSCRFCAHQDHCPAMGALVASVARTANPSLASEYLFDPESNEPEEVEKRYFIAKIVGSWADQQKRKAVQFAKDGMEFPSLVLGSMGAITNVLENDRFIDICVEFGLAGSDIVDVMTVPFAKVRDMVDKEKQKQFVDACSEAGIIKPGTERFTLRDRK